MIPKFRAWDKNGKRYEGSEVCLIGELVIKSSYSATRWVEEAQLFNLCQSTGLRDKNGVEIFEYSELDGVYEVIFKDLRYCLRHVQNNDIIDLHDYWRGKNGEIEVTREYTKV